MKFDNLNEHDLNRVASQMVFDALPNTSTKIKATDILGQNAPYDILWGDTKLSVRVANMSTRSRFPKWNYTVATERDGDMVDMYILITLKGNNVYKVFVLPSEIAPKTTITITEKMGHIRFEMFATELENVAQKIKEVQGKLPKLKELYESAK